MAENQTPILDYGGYGRAESRKWRWLPIGILVGPIVGFCVGWWTYKPTLHAIVGSVQVVVTQLDQPVQSLFRFCAIVAAGGALVPIAAHLAHRLFARASVAIWVAAGTFVFALAAMLATCYARAHVLRLSSGLPPFGCWPMAIPFESLPVLLVPTMGCAAIAVCILALRFGQLLAGRRSRTEA